MDDTRVLELIAQELSIFEGKLSKEVEALGKQLKSAFADINKRLDTLESEESEDDESSELPTNGTVGGLLTAAFAGIREDRKREKAKAKAKADKKS